MHNYFNIFKLVDRHFSIGIYSIFEEFENTGLLWIKYMTRDYVRGGKPFALR